MLYNDVLSALQSFRMTWSGVPIVAIDKFAAACAVVDKAKRNDILSEVTAVTIATPNVIFSRIAAKEPGRIVEDEAGRKYASFGDPTNGKEIRVYPQVPRPKDLPKYMDLSYDVDHVL